MQTVSNTHKRLIIEDRPHFLAAFMWLMGLAAVFAAFTGQTAGVAETLLVAFLGLGTVGIAWHFFPFQRFTFDRKAGDFTRRIARVTGATIDTLPLAEIESAALQLHWSDGARMQRVTLVTKSGPVPLEFGYVGAEREPVVSDINGWLQRQES